MSTVPELAVSPPPRDAAAAACPRHRTGNTRGSRLGPCGGPSVAQEQPQDRGVRGERPAGPAAASRTPRRAARPGGCLSRLRCPQRKPTRPRCLRPRPHRHSPRPEARSAPTATRSPPPGAGRPPLPPRRCREGRAGAARALLSRRRRSDTKWRMGSRARAAAFPLPRPLAGGERGGSGGAECARSCRAPAEGPSPNQSAGPRETGQSAPCDLGGGHPAALRAEPKPRAIGQEGPKSFLLSQPIRAP